MADSYIGLPADGAGKKLDADSLTVSGQTVYRERDRISGAGADDLAVVTDTDAVGVDHGLVVRPIDVVNPICDYLSSADLAAGASVDLDGTAISASAIGKLQAVMVASTVPCKWRISARDGAAETNVGVIVTSPANLTYTWTPPDKRYNTLSGGASANFRVSVTNLDNQNAANVYASIYWDEV